MKKLLVFQCHYDFELGRLSEINFQRGRFSNFDTSSISMIDTHDTYEEVIVTLVEYKFVEIILIRKSFAG